MRRILAAVFLCASLLAIRTAKAQEKVELFGGYSFASVPVTTVVPPGMIPAPIIVNPPVACPSGALCPFILIQSNANTSGWEASGTVKLYRFLGVTADFDGHYGSLTGVNIIRHSFLFGPEVRYHGRVSPFVHGLFGVSLEYAGGISERGFATAIGGGLDIKAGHFLSIRLIQADYFVTHVGNFTQDNNYRLAAGVVFRF